MELHGTERLGLVTDTFVGPVVHVHEPRLPVRAECGRVHRIAMILRSDETFVRTKHTDRLVMAPVTVFELVCRGTCST